MILLTERQMTVFLRLWHLTDGGKRDFVSGPIHVPNIAPSTVNNSIKQFDLLGVATAEMVGRQRRFRVLVSPDHVRIGDACELQLSRHANRAGRESRLVDDGAFVKALQQAKVPMPESVRTTSYGKLTACRPDARAL